MRYIIKDNRIVIFGVLLIWLVQLGSCAHRPAPAKTEDGSVLFRLGFAGTPDSLNPYAAGNEYADAVLSLIYDTLLTTDPGSGRIVPSLCREYTVTPSRAGGMLWRITLRDDAFWHNGERVTASDVEFSLQSAKDYSDLHGYPDCELLDVTGISVEDDTHLAMIVWGEENVAAQCLARIPILPREIWNGSPSVDYDSSGVAADPLRAGEALRSVKPDPETMIGSGLYRFDSYDGARCVLTLNRDYWGGTAQPEVLELCFGVADPAGCVLRNEIDACWEMSLADWQQIGRQAGYHTTAGTRGELYAFRINFRDPSSPVQDISVRRALDCCMNREQILLQVFGGGYAVQELFSPFSQWAGSLSQAERRDFDTAAAAGILEQAGYTDADGDGVREKAGKPLRLTLVCDGALPVWEQACEILRAGCARAGIRVDVRPLTGEALYRCAQNGEYDLLLTSCQSRPEPLFPLVCCYWDDGDNDAYVYDGRGRVSSRGWNESGYADEAYDEIFEQLLSETDPQAVRELTARAGERLYDQAAVLPIGYAVDYQACSSVWAGLGSRIDGLYFTAPGLRIQLQRLTAGKRIN